MSQVRSARVGPAVLVRASRSLLLASALVCASALLPSTGPATATQLRDTVGGLIAFEKDGEIYVTDTNSGMTAKIVDNNDGVVNMQPALSLDASRVAFSSKRDGKFSIYLVGVDGQGLRRVTDNLADDSEPTWSPDGSHLAFVRGFDATGSGVVVLTCKGPGGSDILTVSADAGGEGERPVEVNLTKDAGGGTDPAWSPDGKRIAFASDREGDFNIYTMSSEDGGDVQRLTEDMSAEADPAWSPDGSRIAYTGRLREDRTQQCGNMPIVGDGEEGDTFAEEANREGTNSSMLNGGPYIYRMAADGGQQKYLTEAGIAAEPDWSPDGSHIIFAGKRKGEDIDLYLIAWDGTGPWIQLTFDQAQDKSPSWAGTIIR
jgi:Tol biopolymer transport system component